MMFGLGITKLHRLAPLVLITAALAMPAAAATASSADESTAVVPTEVIYPGQPINRSQLDKVAVTNPNVRNDYVHSLAEIDGMVAVRTLLPGRVIPPSSVRVPYAVRRGKPTRIVYSNQGLTISAPGMPLRNAAAGDFIRVRNTESGVTVSGTVSANGTVEVAAR